MLTVPSSWTCSPIVPAGAETRHRLCWTSRDEPRTLIGVVMYNPSMEGEIVGHEVRAGAPKSSEPVIRDGHTHRRVRALLTQEFGPVEIRVVNLSPVRATKPEAAREACRMLPLYASQAEEEAALRWACEGPVVVAAWGAGLRTSRMERSRSLVLDLAADRLWCWGTSSGGEPLHPSPLGQVAQDARLQRYMLV